jgi:hypothetical protein
MKYHYYSDIVHFKELLETRSIYMSDIASFNDPLESEKGQTFTRLTDSLYTDIGLNQVGAFCLSNDRDRYLMWSYYAKGHKGICVGFDIPFGSWAKDCFLEWPSRHLATSPWPERKVYYMTLGENSNITVWYIDVKYGGGRDVARDGREIVADDVARLFSYKYLMFKEEQESRIIVIGQNSVDKNLKIPMEWIKEITFGLLVNEADIIDYVKYSKALGYSNMNYYREVIIREEERIEICPCFK